MNKEEYLYQKYGVTVAAYLTNQSRQALNGKMQRRKVKPPTRQDSIKAIHEAVRLIES